MTTRPLILGLVAAVLLAGGGWAWQRAGVRQQLVRAALPALPDLHAAPAILRDRLTAADARARRRLTAGAGLEELSRLYHANGFLAEAMACYAGLERLEPAEPRWPHLHATILAGYGEIEPAVALWTRVVRLDPAYLPARLRLGDCELKSNHPASAAAAYAAVLKLAPDNAYARLGLARLDLEAGRWDQARERLETVVNQTHFQLGYDLIVSLYERLGLREKAAAIRGSAKASGAYRDAPDPWLDGLIDVCYDPFRLALNAGVAARVGEPDTAIRLLQRAIALDPKDVSPQFQLGGVYLEQRNFPAAREQFEACTLLAPQFADGWAQLSALQVQTGDVAAGRRSLADGLQHCPDSPGLHLMWARNLRLAGETGESISQYQASIRLRPNEPDAYVELGNLYLQLGQTDEAIRQMRAALEADPGEPQALSIVTFQTITTGPEAEARRWLARVVAQPRVPAGQLARLKELYRQTYGRTWAPDLSGN